MTYGELHEKIINCDGFKIRNQWKNITLSKDIFVDNYYELKKTLKFYEDKMFEINKDKEKLYTFYRRVNKDLHNFVSSNSSLICHARRITNKIYEDKDEMKKIHIDLKNKIFASDEICIFMNDLRNFSVHYSIPIKTMNFSVSISSGVKCKIGFDYGVLSEYENWKNLSKGVLEKIKTGKISLNEIVVSYFEKVEDFYLKLEGYQENFFKKEFFEYEVMRNRYNKSMKPNIDRAVAQGLYPEQEIFKLIL